MPGRIYPDRVLTPNERTKRWREKDGGKYFHAYMVERKYGITGEEYNELLERQDGCCAICHGKNGNRRLAVDHDHNTGEVRGLLCTLCNLVVSHIERDSNLVQTAIDYLAKVKN
jgi:hypothetical protein